MRDEDDKMTVKTPIGLIIYFSALIGGTILCFVWHEYSVLIGFGFCWLLTIAGLIRATREAVDNVSKKK